MLETMRQHSRSLIIYVIFGILIAVFLINFGPQNHGCVPQTSGSAAYVGGREISDQDFRYGFTLMGGSEVPAAQARAFKVKERVLEKLIERELLAGEAERLGYVISDEEIAQQVAAGKVYGLGVPRDDLKRMLLDEEGRFDYDRFRRFSQFFLGLSPRRFENQQRREILANKVRDLLRSSARLSDEEIKAQYIRDNQQVELKFVKLTPRPEELEVSDADVDKYLKEHAAEVRKEYDQRSYQFRGLSKELRLRHLLVTVKKDATPAQVAEAQHRAEGAADRIRKGEPFAKVAKELSDDALTKRRGGDLGWRSLKGTTGFGATVDQALAGLKDGTVSAPLRGDDGFHLLLATDHREGDQPFEKVQRELADELLRTARAREQVKSQAEGILARAKGGATLESAVGSTGSDGPKVETTGLFSRRGAMVPSVGVSPELVKLAFELTPKAPVATKVLDVQGSSVIVALKERKDADLGEMAKKRGDLLREAALVKASQLTEELVKTLCLRARDAGDLTIDTRFISYDVGPDGNPLPAAKDSYRACEEIR